MVHRKDISLMGSMDICVQETIIIFRDSAGNTHLWVSHSYHCDNMYLILLHHLELLYTYVPLVWTTARRFVNKYEMLLHNIL